MKFIIPKVKKTSTTFPMGTLSIVLVFVCMTLCVRSAARDKRECRHAPRHLALQGEGEGHTSVEQREREKRTQDTTRGREEGRKEGRQKQFKKERIK